MAKCSTSVRWDRALYSILDTVEELDRADVGIWPTIKQSRAGRSKGSNQSRTKAGVIIKGVVVGTQRFANGTQEHLTSTRLGAKLPATPDYQRLLDRVQRGWAAPRLKTFEHSRLRPST